MVLVAVTPTEVGVIHHLSLGLKRVSRVALEGGYGVHLDSGKCRCGRWTV